MASTIRFVEKRGDHLMIRMSDGSVTRALLMPNGWWAVPSKAAPTPPPGGGSSGTMITPQMITAAVQSSGASPTTMLATADSIAKAFNDAIVIADTTLLSSKARAACLVGECAKETDWFRTTVEYGGGVGKSYYPYCGRGFIQLTWQSNYAAFGHWCVSKNLVSDANYFVNNPTELAQLKWAALTAVWYFSKTFSGYTLWQWCDKVNTPWVEISNAINSGSVNGSSYDVAGRSKAIDAALAVAPDVITPGGVTAQLVDWIIAHEGKYYYSQGSGRMSPDTSGYTDCSALMWYCYQQVAKVNVGTWTGDQQNYGTKIQDGSGSKTDVSDLKPGDLVFFNWNTPTTVFDHVEMYLGKGKYGADTICGHGGDPYYGPVEKSLAGQTGAALGGWRVRRYV